jgi:hypothetical protein
VRLKDNARKRFCENVRGIFNAGSVFDNKRVGLDVGANEVITDVDVFGLPMVGVID